MISPQESCFSADISGNGSGLGLLHTGIGHPHSTEAAQDVCPEGLPTVMAQLSWLRDQCSPHPTGRQPSAAADSPLQDCSLS